MPVNFWLLDCSSPLRLGAILFSLRQSTLRVSIAARGLEREGPTSAVQWEGERSDYTPGRDPPPA